MLAGLKDILVDANREGRAAPCFNVFNLDFIYAIVKAAEQEDAPVILALNQDMVDHYTLEVMIPLLLAVAKQSKASICPHLDHTYLKDQINNALQHGLKSVMYDGSQLSLEENISVTKEISELVKSYEANLEGEIGSVAYADNDPKKQHIKSEKTDVEQAVVMAEQSGVDALAVSIGNVHRLESALEVDLSLLDALSDRIKIPLVIHGTSGIDHAQIKKMATSTQVAKFNIATDLRMSWGKTVRNQLEANPKLYDPFTISTSIESAMVDRAKYWINLLR